jgi:hypothetical protein
MPFRVTRTVTRGDEKEILKYPVGLHAVKSVVLDGNTFAVNADGSRTVVPSGTVLKLSASNPNMYQAYAGSGTIQGILAHDVDIAAQATAGSEPAPMFFHGCVFATTAIVGFTTYAAALVSGMPTCKFE